MSIWTQKSALIQLRTTPLKFDDSAEKSRKFGIELFNLVPDRPHNLALPLDHAGHGPLLQGGP